MSNSTNTSTQNNTTSSINKIRPRKENNLINKENNLLVDKYFKCKNSIEKERIFEKLLKNNEGLINKLVNKYGNLNNDLKNDLSAEANQELYNSLLKFDISTNNKFGTFLTIGIEGVLKKYVNRKMREVSVPEEKILKKIKLDKDKNKEEYNDEINNLIGAKLFYSSSLDSTDEDGDYDFNIQRYSMDESIIPDDIFLENKEMKEMLNNRLEILSDIEYDIIVKSYGLDDNEVHTATELAIDFDKTGAGIGFIKMNALKKIRNSLEDTL